MDPILLRSLAHDCFAHIPCLPLGETALHRFRQAL
jgi:hypothetical protein